MVRKLRIYLDTSVFGGAEDEEFSEVSKRLFDQIQAGHFTVLISTQLLAELAQAPAAVREVLDELPSGSLEWLEIDHEVHELADAYLEARVVGETAREDAIHVAAASVAEADLILSWNFKHIVRFDRIRKFNGVNAVRGYRALDIRSPLEVEDDAEE